MVPSQRHGALVLAMPMRRCAPPSGVPLRVEGSAVSQGGPPCRSKAESHASICLDDFFCVTNIKLLNLPLTRWCF